MFVVIQTGGKQINVSYGQEIFIEKIIGETKDKVIFDKILMIDQQFGKPFLKGAEVHGEILKQDKEKKIRVFKYKPKKNSKTMYGHRQPYTKVLITDILLEGKSIVDKSKQLKPIIKDDEIQKIVSDIKSDIVKDVIVKDEVSKPAIHKIESLKNDEVQKTASKIKAEITEPIAVANKEPIVNKVKSKPESKAVTKKVAKSKPVAEDNNPKTVIVEGDLKTIFDHKKMTVKIINEKDEKNKK